MVFAVLLVRESVVLPSAMVRVMTGSSSANALPSSAVTAKVTLAVLTVMVTVFSAGSEFP